MVGWAGDATRFDRELRGEGPACALGSAYCDPAREGARPDAVMGGPLPNAQDLNERQAKPPPACPGFSGAREARDLLRLGTRVPWTWTGPSRRRSPRGRRLCRPASSRPCPSAGSTSA